MKIYDRLIMEAVRQNLGLEEDDTSMDDVIMEMSKREVFERYWTWQGIIGYTDEMFDTVALIFGITIDDE